MKKIILLVSLIFGFTVASAETITATYYGTEIDLSQKNNPCKGPTDGGAQVIVVTNVSSVKNAPNRTVVQRTYKLPSGEILKTDREIIDSPKPAVLHSLFPHQYPKVNY